MKKVCVFIGSRANYSSLKSVLLHIKAHPQLELQTLVGSFSVLDRFGSVVNLMEADGLKIAHRFYNILEGESPLTMATSTGLGLIEAAGALENLRPDFVFVVGDRFEIMSVAIASAYMNIPLVHSMGGEVTGTIDESIRHAITKLAHIHFPANEESRERIIKMGENPDYVFNTGCPRIDLVRQELENDSAKVLTHLYEVESGVGDKIDLQKPFLLVSQHPVTTEYGKNREHMNETLKCLADLAMNTIMIWPNGDAGSDEVSRSIRVFRERYRPKWLSVFKNVPTAHYIHLMNKTACLIGNSSSGIREGAFIGTPVVNVGSRQNSRGRAQNVLDVDYEASAITAAVKKQMSHGKYSSDTIYGDGFAGEKIASILSSVTVDVQKRNYF